LKGRLLMKEKSRFISKIALIAVLSSMTFTALRAESLYPINNRFSNIANRIAAQRGDILRVIVEEERATSNTLETTTSKESSITNEVNQFLFENSGFGTHNGGLPGTDITGENEYKAGGTITSEQKMTDTFSVMVTDVLPNGNMVIQGARRMKTSDQTEYVTISGIVRYDDISADNTINSNLIYDVKLDYLSEGVIRKAEKKGWLEKLNGILNPF